MATWTVGALHCLTPVISDAAELGTANEYGCRWCGRTTKLDTVEVCEQLNGIVHADCHDARCTDVRCRWLTCTEDRCEFLTDCENCGAPTCERHGVHLSCA